MCTKTIDSGAEAAVRTVFSLSELKKLLEKENTCVSCVTTQHTINLTPMHLSDFKTSVRALLDEKVNKYDVELGGVVLAQKNVKIVAESIVLTDSRYFPLEYIADIYLFKPKIGSKLTGVVNKINKQYVSVLVHNIFNVVVYGAPKQPIRYLTIGSSINVTVTQIDFTGRLPFIRAEISSEALHAQDDSGEMEEDNMLPPPPLTPARKGLSSILKNSPARVPLSSTEVDTESSGAESEKRKKKKKKDKKRNDERIQLDESKNDDSPSKKRKRPHDDDDELSSPSKKKKKKNKEHDDRNVVQNDGLTNPLESTQLILSDQSIFKAVSSTPVSGSPVKKSHKASKSKADIEHNLQKATITVKNELKTADSGISSSDEKKVKVKRETESSERDIKKTSKNKTTSDKKDKSKKNKGSSKKEKRPETTDEITARLLEEALLELKTEK